MRFCPFKLTLLLTCFLSVLALRLQANEVRDEKSIGVSLRMIGHQVLLEAGDSTGRVLPVEREGNSYRIRFENEFVLNPDAILRSAMRYMLEAHMASAYFLEVEDCATGKVVYSYKMAGLGKEDLIPCQSRAYPKGCYTLLFTLTDPITRAVPEQEPVPAKTSVFFYLLPSLALLLLVWWFARRRKDTPSHDDPQVVAIGAYAFHMRSGELRHEGQRIELTGKEAELLILLHTQLNQTVERDLILHRVWGDEGDYIGRTLDVFVSRLRKKLELDASVRIVNVRGVGYKLVIGD